MKRWLIATLMITVALITTPILLANKILDVSPSKYMLSKIQSSSGTTTLEKENDCKTNGYHKNNKI